MDSPLAFEISHTEITGSTNDDAVGLAREGAPEGTVIVADAQAGGRGRLGGRVWESPQGGAYFSLVVRPECGQEQVSTLSLVVALAVHEALGAFGVESQLKYPNDVFVADRKICGILLESGTTSQEPYVVIGIGVNVFPPGNAGEQFAYLANHVDSAEPTLIDETVGAVLGAFAREYREWQRSCTLSLEQDRRYRSLLVNPEAYARVCDEDS